MSPTAFQDPVRAFTPEEDERLALNLRRVTDAVFHGALNDRQPDTALLQDLHRAIFDGVRDHAGRIRRSDFGQEHLAFGPNRSEHRSRVPLLLGELFANVRRSIASFDDNPNDPL